MIRKDIEIKIHPTPMLSKLHFWHKSLDASYQRTCMMRRDNLRQSCCSRVLSDRGSTQNMGECCLSRSQQNSVQGGQRHSVTTVTVWTTATFPVHVKSFVNEIFTGVHSLTPPSVDSRESDGAVLGVLWRHGRRVRHVVARPLVRLRDGDAQRRRRQCECSQGSRRSVHCDGC